MIKLTKKQDKDLKCFRLVSYDDKIEAIRELGGLYYSKNYSDDEKLTMAKAILDGEWEVEEPLYYIKLLPGECGYLNKSKRDGRLHPNSKETTLMYKTKFTRQEAIAIDPRYEKFLEKV